MENEKYSHGNGGLVVALVITLLIIGGLIFYILYPNTAKTSQIITSTNDNKTSTTSSPTTTTSSVSAKCYGTYYGESGTLKYTYVLNKDFTFTADFTGASATKGVFTINGNTVSFTGLKETTGPSDEDPHYSTSDYIMADDCSYIKIPSDQVGGNSAMILNKK